MAAFIMLGLPDGTLGVAWPSIRSTFGLPLGALGLMLAPATASYLLSGAVSGHLITRFGLRRVLLGSMAMFLISLALVGLSPLWWFLPLGTTVLGFGAGTLDAALNAFAATHHAQRFLGLLKRYIAFLIHASILSCNCMQVHAGACGCVPGPRRVHRVGCD